MVENGLINARAEYVPLGSAAVSCAESYGVVERFDRRRIRRKSRPSEQWRSKIQAFPLRVAWLRTVPFAMVVVTVRTLVWLLLLGAPIKDSSAVPATRTQLVYNCMNRGAFQLSVLLDFTTDVVEFIIINSLTFNSLCLITGNMLFDYVTFFICVVMYKLCLFGFFFIFLIFFFLFIFFFPHSPASVQDAYYGTPERCMRPARVDVVQRWA